MADEKQMGQQAPPEPPANTGDSSGDNGSTGNSEQTGDTGRTFTQAELDAALGRRLARERKAWETEAEAARKKADMSEAEKLKAEKDEAEAKSSAAVKAANARIVRTEARAALADAGVKAERRDYALRMLDLSEISLDDNGEPDSKALKAAVEALLKDIPELKGAGVGAAGAEFPAGSGGPNPETMTMPDYMAWRKTQT